MSRENVAPVSESTILKVFVAVLSVICVVTVANLQPDQWNGWLHLVLLSLMTTLAAAWSVRIKALGFEVTPTDPFVLFAMAVIGLRAAVLLAVVAVAAGVMWRGRRLRPIQHAFNFVALPLAAAAAGQTYSLMGGPPGVRFETAVLPLLCAAGVYLLLNTGSTAAAIALSRRSSFLRVWFRGVWWTAGSTITALSVALCMMLLVEALGTWGLAFAFPPVIALAATQRLNKVRLDVVDPAGDPASDGAQ